MAQGNSHPNAIPVASWYIEFLYKWYTMKTHVAQLLPILLVFPIKAETLQGFGPSLW
jgi:hypothetical protein